MDMKLIMYTSKANSLPSVTGVPANLLSIVRECRTRNPVNDISGALYYSHGRYLQIIEGRGDRVNRLMRNILKDTRHEQCSIQLEVMIKRRIFPRWQSQLNTTVVRDPYLRQFMTQYSESLRAMSSSAKAEFNHVVKNKFIKPDKSISIINVNVFGEEKLSLANVPDSLLGSNPKPIMMNLCHSLVQCSRTVDELVAEHGMRNHDEILDLLKTLNHQGLLQFGDYNG